MDENYYKTFMVGKVQKRGSEVLEARKNSSVFSAANAIKGEYKIDAM